MTLYILIIQQKPASKHAVFCLMCNNFSFCYFSKEFPDIDDLLPVIPSSTKLDVERIKNDIPKYYPFLQPSSADDWETFCNNDINALLSEEISTEVTQELQAVY